MPRSDRPGTRADRPGRAIATAHRVAVLAVPPVTSFDLAIPELVFGGTLVEAGPAYEVLVCTP